MTLTWEQVAALCVAASALVTGLWHIAMHIGKLTNRVDRHEDRLNWLEDKVIK